MQHILCVPTESLGTAGRVSPQPGVTQGSHLSLAASSSARLLRSSGILPASQLAWQKVSLGCLEGYRSVTPCEGSGGSWEHCQLSLELSPITVVAAPCPCALCGAVVQPCPHPGLPCRWLEHSLAHHGSVAVSVLWPQLELLWKASGEMARDVSQQCCSLLSWLHGNLPWLSDWVSGGSRAAGDRDCNQGNVFVTAPGIAGVLGWGQPHGRCLMSPVLLRLQPAPAVSSGCGEAGRTPWCCRSRHFGGSGVTSECGCPVC